MAKFITRTIASTQIVIGELKVGSTEVEAIGKIVEEGKIELEKATKVIQKAFKGRNVLVLDLVHDEAKYKISVEDFINVAEKVEDTEEVEPLEETEEVVA
ncbi:double-strand binding protein [Bacillus phage MG-B1]|uniref:Double-strand binding protein n=1 Tax=Bacillus phage MG-B1 TaxID=1309583 RepID=M4W5Z0_9CAUD|nr:dsDNA binding protein [Bacillus phage MG-B1]AGI10614.1 double-strand binding protein [Bacillus phage MG-B1]